MMRLSRFFLCFMFIIIISSKVSASQVKIGVLPIVDALPFYVAEQNGLFKTLPKPVTLITFRSAIERDAAFQTKKIDAYVGDLISAALLRSRGFPAKAASIILGKQPDEGLFAILSPPSSSIRTIRDLKGKHVAISSNTIIEYVLNGLLKSHGMSPENIKKQEIKSIPIRFQMLMSGKIDAAVLPDPLASLARFKGAHWIADDSDTNLSQTVLIWNDHFIKTHALFLRGFYRAYDKAVKIINHDHEKVRTLLVRKCRLPKPIARTFKFSDFPLASAPQKNVANSVLRWLKEKNLLKHPVKAGDFIVTKEFFKQF